MRVRSERAPFGARLADVPARARLDGRADALTATTSTGAHAGSCSATGTPQVEHDGSWIRFHPEASLSNTRSVRPSSCLTSHKVEAYSPMTVQTPSAGVARRMIRTPGRKSEERRGTPMAGIALFMSLLYTRYIPAQGVRVRFLKVQPGWKGLGRAHGCQWIARALVSQRVGHTMQS